MWFTVHQSKALMFINLFLPEMQTEKFIFSLKALFWYFNFDVKDWNLKIERLLTTENKQSRFKSIFNFPGGV